QPGPRKERLNAATASAIAPRPRALVIFRPRQRVVSPLSGNRIRTGKRTTVDDDAAADTGTEDDAEDHARTSGRAIRRFRNREAVRVVGQTHRTPQHPLEVGTQPAAIEPGRVRVLHKAGCRRLDAGNADADSGGARMHLAFGAGDEICYRRKGRVVVAARRVHAGAHLLAPRFVERRNLDLRAAEVDAETNRHEVDYPPPDVFAQSGLETLRRDDRTAPDRPRGRPWHDAGADRPERLGQVDAAAFDGGPRPADIGRGPFRRPADFGRRFDRGASPYGLCRPGRRAVPASHRARERRDCRAIPGLGRRTAARARRRTRGARPTAARVAEPVDRKSTRL